ncbi:MAG: YbaN family protein [Betaproteobacteria bacterium]|nr:YbaN family protein [Betaproteobacteria bacterium]
MALGFVALGLALLGVFLPILPTTPFVLLAAALFARGSESLHRYLWHHRIFGPIIQDWHEHRSMPPGIKPWAFGLLALSFIVSISIIAMLWLKLVLLALGVTLALFLWRVPVRSLTAEEDRRRNTES